jgi:hypothetical protein
VQLLSVAIRLVCVFGVFYLFRLAKTLVDFVVCHWMLADGCLVFVGLRLFDLFSLLVVVEVMFARNIGGDGLYLGLLMNIYGFDGSLVVLVCGTSWWC